MPDWLGESSRTLIASGLKYSYPSTTITQGIGGEKVSSTEPGETSKKDGRIIPWAGLGLSKKVTK